LSYVPLRLPVAAPDFDALAANHQHVTIHHACGGRLELVRHYAAAGKDPIWAVRCPCRGWWTLERAKALAAAVPETFYRVEPPADGGVLVWRGDGAPPKPALLRAAELRDRAPGVGRAG
jgi:hypothetical protein